MGDEYTDLIEVDPDESPDIAIDSSKRIEQAFDTIDVRLAKESEFAALLDECTTQFGGERKEVSIGGATG